MPGPLLGGKGENFPIYFVTWPQAKEFCLRLTASAHQAGHLPMPEAQWEYACRAGTTTAFAFGDTLTKAHAVIGKPFSKGHADGTPRAAAEPVGSLPPNAWGLHDMHGNQFEWARDWFHPRLPGGTDPDLSDVKGQPNRDGSYSRARRGGAWMDPPEFARSAFRLPYEPDRNADHIGFQLAIVSTSPRG